MPDRDHLVRIPHSLFEDMRRLAEAHERNVQSEVRVALQSYIRAERATLKLRMEEEK